MEKSIKYFVFCTYHSNYPHQALFVPIKSKIMVSLQPYVDKLICLFAASKTSQNHIPIIQKLYKKFGENMTTCSGHLVNDVIDESDETFELIDYWTNIQNHYNYYNDDVNDQSQEMFLYYINDANQNLSPKELYLKLLSLTTCNERAVIVEECFMVSEEPLDYEAPVILRFFNDNAKLTINEIKQILLTDNRIKYVKPASNDGIFFAGYGYVWLDGINTADDLLLNKKVFDNDLKVFFDRG